MKQHIEVLDRSLSSVPAIPAGCVGTGHTITPVKLYLAITNKSNQIATKHIVLISTYRELAAAGRFPQLTAIFKDEAVENVLGNPDKGTQVVNLTTSEAFVFATSMTKSRII